VRLRNFVMLVGVLLSGLIAFQGGALLFAQCCPDCDKQCGYYQATRGTRDGCGSSWCVWKDCTIPDGGGWSCVGSYPLDTDYCENEQPKFCPAGPNQY